MAEAEKVFEALELPIKRDYVDWGVAHFIQKGKVVPPDIFKPGVKDLPIRAGFAPIPKSSVPKKVAIGAAVVATAIAVATALVNVLKNMNANKVEKEAEVKPQEVNVPEVETTEIETPEVGDTQE